MCDWLVVVMRLFGVVLMTDRIERIVIEELAQRLAANWLQDYQVSGVKAFIENEKKREAILADAKRLDIYDPVYKRANEIFHGGK